MVIPGLRGMSLRHFFREMAKEIVDNRLTDVAAQLAYNAILALFPFLIFIVTILGFLPIKGVTEEILGVMHRMLPGDSASLIDGTVHGVVDAQHGRLLAISIVGSMWAASGGVQSFSTALNHTYRARETRSWIRVRAQSLLITIVGSVLLIVATTALLIGPQLVEKVSGWVGLGSLVATVWSWFRWPSTVVAMSCLLALMYWACPNVKQKFRFVTPGSVMAVPVWIGVSLLFNIYVTRLASFNRTYGALGAGVVLLIWIWISGFIVLIGGTMNAVIEGHSIDGAPASNQPERAKGAAAQVVAEKQGAAASGDQPAGA